MSEESLIAESYSNLKSAILLGRTDIVRGILSTAAESRLENGFFEDEEDEENGEDIRIKKWDEDYEDNPYDLLRVILNYVDDDAGSALHLSTKLGHIDITRALLAAGSDPARLNKEGVTPFEYCTDEKVLKIYNEQVLEAAAHNQLVKLQKLLDAGVSANANDGTDSNNRALHWAASFGGQESVKILCEHGADPNVINSSGTTPLFDAIKRRDIELVKMLLRYGAKSDVILTKGRYKGKSLIELTPEGSEIKELLLSPPEQITPEKPTSEVNVSLAESEAIDRDSNSDSHYTDSVGENKGEETKVEETKVEETKHTTRELELDLLWPYPQQLTLIKGNCYFPEAYININIVTGTGQDSHSIQDMWRVVEESFKKIGFCLRTRYVSELTDDSSFNVPGCITCCICPLLFSRPESYSIHVSSQKISLCGSETRSLWYGINTLTQLFKLAKGVGIPQMQINDWPDLKYRAALVDVGHERTLNSDSLIFIADVLSNLKYNQLVLSLPNSFRHSNSKNKVPYGQSDIIKLERFCRKRYIELIPYLDYSSNDLESVPDTSTENEKTSITELNSYICSSFSLSRFIHLGMNGLDEVGTEALEEQGKVKDEENVLYNHLKNGNENCKKHKKISMFWANSFHDHIKQGKEIPRGTIAMEYGGKPGYNFGLFCKLCLDSGIPYYVCPGTLTWNSLVGAWTDSIDLIDEAVQCAVNYNALGILVTDWSGYGNLTPIDVSMSSFVAAAALAWNSKIKQESVMSSLARVLDLYVFQDEACLVGEIFQNLSEVHNFLEPSGPPTTEPHQDDRVLPDNKPENAYRILQLFMFPNLINPSQLHSENIQKALRCLRKCQSSLSKVQLKCRRSSYIVKTLNLMVDMALFGCRVARAVSQTTSEEKLANNSTAISVIPSITRTDLANRLLSMIDNYQRISDLSARRGDSNKLIEQLQIVFQQIVPPSSLDV